MNISKTVARLFLFVPLIASAASATSPTYLTPSEVLARLRQFDGAFVALGGRLRLDSGARCLTIGEGRWAGRFGVNPVEAIGIRRHEAHLAGRFVIVEGMLRANPSTHAASACSEARIERVTIRAATP
jgi:hypothetical protein